MNDDIDIPGWDEEQDPQEDRQERRRGRLAVFITLGVVAALVLGVGIYAANYVLKLRDSYEKRTVVSISRGPSDGDAPSDGEGSNYLLLGSDKRSPADEKSQNVSGQRSDVMMLVHVDADRSEVYVTSFPRDLYIDIPGHGKDRINSALAYGGVPLAVTAVENYTGVPIEHVGLIDFDGVEGLVDTLGGVDVRVPQDFESGGSTFHKGIQRVDGKEALAFVRARKNFSEGDFQRNRNQQSLMEGIAKKVISAGTLTDPGKISDLVSKISPFLTTDEGLDGRTMVNLGFGLRGVRNSDIHFLSVPHGDPYTTKGGASVVATDEDQMDILRTALSTDDMATYYSDHVENS